MSEPTREKIEASLEEIRKAVSAFMPGSADRMRLREAERLVARESELEAVAFLLDVSAERAAEIAASVPWSVGELRLRCAAGWQPEVGDVDLPDFEELRALVRELRAERRPEALRERRTRPLRARLEASPMGRPIGRALRVAHRVSPRRDRARSRPGGKSAARGLR